MPPEQILQIQVDQAVSRLDLFLTEAVPGISRSQIQKLIRQGRVWLATPATGPTRPITRPGAGVQPGDVLILHLPAPPSSTLQPEGIPLDRF
jgi:23S rRNA pseudouridine1911/1915/1917 synthase